MKKILLILLVTVLLSVVGSVSFAEPRFKVSASEVMDRVSKGQIDPTVSLSVAAHIPGFQVIPVGATTMLLGETPLEDGGYRRTYSTSGVVRILAGPLTETQTDTSYTVSNVISIYWDETYIGGQAKVKLWYTESTWSRLDSTWNWRDAEMIACSMWVERSQQTIGVPYPGTTYELLANHSWYSEVPATTFEATNNITMYRQLQDFIFTAYLKKTF